MQEPAERGPDGTDAAADGDPARTWVHPSELGWESRSRSDRRRGAWLAAALVLGGVGLLAVGLVIGVGSDRTPATARTSPDRELSAVLASLTVVDGAHHRTVTGVVLDPQGHVAVRSGSVGDGQEIWVSCEGSNPQRAQVVARDHERDLAIVLMDEPAGRPVTASAPTRPGDDVVLARAGAGEAGPALSTARIVAAPTENRRTTLRVVTSTTDPVGVNTSVVLAAPTSTGTDDGTGAADGAGDADGAAFDTQGHFLGLITGEPGSPQLLPAAVVLQATAALLR